MTEPAHDSVMFTDRSDGTVYVHTSIDKLLAEFPEKPRPLPPAVVPDTFALQSHEQALRVLERRRKQLAAEMSTYARRQDEEVDDYLKKRTMYLWGPLSQLVEAKGKVLWHEAEERRTKREEAAAKKERDDRVIADLRARAEPDEDNIKQLASVTKKAKEGEQLLADLGRALLEHITAQQARATLSRTFESALTAPGAGGPRHHGRQAGGASGRLHEPARPVRLHSAGAAHPADQHPARGLVHAGRAAARLAEPETVTRRRPNGTSLGAREMGFLLGLSRPNLTRWQTSGLSAIDLAKSRLLRTLPSHSV